MSRSTRLLSTVGNNDVGYDVHSISDLVVDTPNRVPSSFGGGPAMQECVECTFVKFTPEAWKLVRHDKLLMKSGQKMKTKTKKQQKRNGYCAPNRSLHQRPKYSPVTWSTDCSAITSQREGILRISRTTSLANRTTSHPWRTWPLPWYHWHVLTMMEISLTV